MTGPAEGLEAGSTRFDTAGSAATNDDLARTILDAVTYVVLATADADGVPWASPVWFVHERYRELFWVSSPGARHSGNVAARPQLAMVVFDSTVAPGTGQAVYMAGTALQVTGDRELERGLGIISRGSLRQGGRPFGLDDVRGDARLRLYRADVHEHSILEPDSPHDVRIAVRP